MSVKKFRRDIPLYSIDWCHGILRDFTNVTLFFQKLGEIDPRLSFDCFEHWDRGFYNCSERYCLCGRGFFTVAFNPDPDYVSLNSSDLRAVDSSRNKYNPGIFVSITGDGLRYLGDKTVKRLFHFFNTYGFRCSRLDIACDIFDKDNPYVPLYLDAFYHASSPAPGDHTLATRLPRNKIQFFMYLDTLRGGTVTNVSIGDKASACCKFRMYDKWFELKSGRLKNMSDEMLDMLPDDYWYRFEFEMHNRYADALFKSLASGQITCASAFEWSSRKAFRIVDAKTSGYDFCVCPVNEIYEKFLQLVDFYRESEGVIQLAHFV